MELTTAITAIGRRKSATARVRLTPNGSGSITVNAHAWREYFPVSAYQETIREPLVALGREDTIDVEVIVAGGGKKGQADAVRLGIARAILALDSTLRKTLKTRGMLSRDARVKERKKPGLRKARRASQWSKR